MTRKDKEAAVESLKKTLEENVFFYITDSSALTVAQVSDLRRQCFENGVAMQVVKNTLAKKALESFPEEKQFSKLYDSLKGPSAIMFSSVANLPAKIISDFRKKHEKPVLKAAYIDTDVFLGDDNVKTLKSLKTKEELLSEILDLLDSPIRNLISSLESGANTITGILTTLEEKTS